jgi:antirestriction protein ArdC
VDRAELYAAVTDAVVTQIEAGAGSWSMPWRAIADAGQPVNAATGAAYRGGNIICLGLTAAANSWGGYWATYKQWQGLGAQVRRGEKSTLGVKWSVVAKRAAGADGDTMVDEQGRRLVPFVFHVFAADQVDGWTPPEAEERGTPARIVEADRFFNRLGARVNYGGNSASYSLAEDLIRLPNPEQFDEAGDLYATSAHEHAHWTGHSSRLGRDLTGRFGSDSYGVEELIAELSAAFTCAHLGISTVPRPDHASYLASWLRVLRADTSALFTAAARAQAATDFLVEKADVASAEVGDQAA